MNRNHDERVNDGELSLNYVRTATPLAGRRPADMYMNRCLLTSWN